MKTTLDLSILAVNIAMMLAVGMGLEATRFAELARCRRVVPVALLGQMILLPAIGWGLTRVLAVPPHVSAGILLIAACPVGDIANFYTMLARGNVALSVSVNTISCLIAAASMAVVFDLYSRLTGATFMFAAPPLQLTARLLLITALPVGSGMLLRRWAPRLAAKLRPGLQAGSILGIAAVIGMIVVVQGDLLKAEWKSAVTVSFALLTVATAAGWITSALLGLDVSDRMTFAMIFPARNVALATAVAVTMLGRVEYAAFAVLYFVTEVPLLLVLVALHRSRFTPRNWASCPGATP